MILQDISRNSLVCLCINQHISVNLSNILLANENLKLKQINNKSLEKDIFSHLNIEPKYLFLHLFNDSFSLSISSFIFY